MNMKKLAALVMALVLCLTAAGAMAETTRVTVSTNEQLEAALMDAYNQSTAGDVEITIAENATLNGTFHIRQREGVDVTLKGDGKTTTIQGRIRIWGYSRYTGTETVTIEGILFDATGVNDFVIGQNNTTEAERYAHNVTIENCHFKGNGEGINAVKFRQSFGTNTIKNCTVDHIHSLYWGTGNQALVVDNVVVTNCEEGMTEGTAANVSITNSSFDVEGHAIRTNLDGGKPLNLTLENNTIVAEQPIILRGESGSSTNNIEIKENTFPNMTPDQIDKVITFTNENSAKNQEILQAVTQVKQEMAEKPQGFVIEMQTEDGKTYDNSIVYPGYGDVVLKSSDRLSNFKSVTLYHNNKKIVKTSSLDTPLMKVEEGSIKVTVKEEAIKEFGYGTYKLEIESVGDTVTGTFVFLAPPSVPQTGDNSSMMLWAGMLMLAMAGFAASRKTRLN